MLYNNKPSKLIDCRQHGATSGSELFIVEGESAAQAVAKQRDGRFQAVLPMQGKPMNPLRASSEKIQSNELYAALIQTIGAGFGVKLDIQARKYQRIILMMDPDADGIHCGALMTLFFHKWFQPLMTENAIYLVRPPVGQRTHIGTKKVEYAYTMPDFQAMLNQANSAEYDAFKYRGLAGIPQSHLEACCINPQTRKQMVLTEIDAKMAKAVFA